MRILFNKKIIINILLHSLLTGFLFAASNPKIDQQSLLSKKQVDLQAVYDELTDAPAVILLKPDGTTGVSVELLDQLNNEIKNRMVMNSVFKPVSMTKWLDGKYNDKREKNLFAFFDQIRYERYQIPIKGLFKSKIFKVGNQYILYMAVLPLGNKGYPVTSVRVFRNEKDLAEAVDKEVLELSTLMKMKAKESIRLAVAPVEISCRTLVEQNTGEFDFIKTSFSNQGGIELKETDDYFSYLFSHQATATGLFRASPLGLVSEYAASSIKSTSLSGYADYFIKGKILLSDRKNIMSLSLVKVETGATVRKAAYFIEKLDSEEIWKLNNYFISEICKSLYRETEFKVLRNITYSGKGFYKDGMFVGWDSLDGFPVPASKLIINTGSLMESDISVNPDINYSRKNHDLYVYVNNDEMKIFHGREGAFVWNLLEK